MPNKNDIKEAVKTALKARNKIEVETLRTVLSELQYEEIQKKVDDLSEEDFLTALKREIKKRTEELGFAKQANRSDLQESLGIEIKTIEAFLPKQLSPEDLQRIIEEWKSATPGLNMGAAMKALKESYPGQYDSKLASDITRQVLSS